MAKGKQKQKAKQAEEPKTAKAQTTNASSKKGDKSNGYSDKEEVEALFERSASFPTQDGSGTPTLMTRPINHEYSDGPWPAPTGGVGRPGQWGGSAGNWVQENNWETVPQNQFHNPPPVPSKSPAPFPPKNNDTGLGTIPENRYSSSMRSAAGPYEHQDEYSYQEHEDYQNHDNYDAAQARAFGNEHGKSWDVPASAPSDATHIPPVTAAGMTAPSVPVQSPAPAPPRAMTPPPTSVTDLALAEYRSKPLKYTSASEAAKKVESKTSSANRNSFWAQTHEQAASQRGIFIPQPEGVPKSGKGPRVEDPKTEMPRGPKLHEMTSPPAWMQWGNPQKNKPQSQSQPQPQPQQHPQPQKHGRQHPQQGKYGNAASAHQKGGASWQHWDNPAHARERFVPPSDDSSEDEEDWEDDGDWDGQQWGHQGRPSQQHGGHQAWDHVGGQQRGHHPPSQGWGDVYTGHSKSGDVWGPSAARGDAAPSRGKQAGGPDAWNVSGGGHSREGALGGGRGGGGRWDHRESTAGYTTDDGWGQSRGDHAWGDGTSHSQAKGYSGHGADGWAQVGTSKVNFDPSRAAKGDVLSGNRNALSPHERSQILNNLLNGAIEQKSKAARHAADMSHAASGDGHGYGWGDDGWAGSGLQSQEKEKETKKKNTASHGMNGDRYGWGDDSWGTGGQQSQGKDKKEGKDKKKKEKEKGKGRGWTMWGKGGESKKQQGDGWENGARGQDEWWQTVDDKKKKKNAKNQDDWGAWGGAEDEWGLPASTNKKTKKQDKGERDGWGGDDDDDGWGGGGGGGGGDDDGWGDGDDGWGGDADNTYDDGGWGGGNENSWAAWDTGGKKSKKKEDPLATWAASGGQGGWGNEGNEDDHRVRFATREAPMWGSQAGTASGMPSKTMQAAQGYTHNGPTPEQISGIKLLESKEAAFEGVKKAFYSFSRPAKERFHWMFPPENDPRIVALLHWIQVSGPAIGALGLQKFLQTRERGALFVNATFRLPEHPGLPVFDWLTFDRLQPTMDKTLQESAAFYDPAAIAVVFIYLSSPTGNSIAIWRRKIPVPKSVTMALQKEIGLMKMGLRPESEYVVYVEEMPPRGARRGRPPSNKTPQYATSVPAPVQQAGPVAQKPKVVVKQPSAPSVARKANVVHPTNPTKAKVVEVKKKKRKWWHFFSNL